MIKGKIKLNGTEIEVTSDDSNSMEEVLGYLIGNQKRQYNRKEESGDEADAEPKSEEQSVSTTVVNKRPNAHRPRTPYVTWDEKDVLVLAHAAIRFGSKITGIGKYAFEALAASGSTGRKLENVSIIAMRIHRYVYTGKNYGLSKPILDKDKNVIYPGGKYEKAEIQLLETLRTIRAVPSISAFINRYKRKVCLMSYLIKPDQDSKVSSAQKSFGRYKLIESRETGENGALLEHPSINAEGFEFRRISHEYSFRLS